MRSIKAKLTFLNFLEFAIWGSYLTSLGNFLANKGLAQQIGWFYAVQGIVCHFEHSVVVAECDELYSGIVEVFFGEREAVGEESHHADNFAEYMQLHTAYYHAV